MSVQKSVKSPQISLVIPLYNEEDNLSFLFDRLLAVVSDLNVSYEIICVNDGSRDRTWDYLLK